MEDEEVAKQLQEQMECEEALHSRILEQADQVIISKLYSWCYLMCALKP